MLLGLANIFAQLEQWKDADYIIREAIALRPDEFLYHFTLGNIYAAMVCCIGYKIYNYTHVVVSISKALQTGLYTVTVSRATSKVPFPHSSVLMNCNQIWPLRKLDTKQLSVKFNVRRFNGL